MQKYRIVHLSDLHITARDSDPRYEVSLPHKKLRGMNDAFQFLLRTPQLQLADHIIITGDITDKGEVQAWKKFWKYLQSANLEHKTSFVIGNHDICELGRVNFYLSKKEKNRRIGHARTRLKRRLTSIGHTYNYPWVRLLREDIAIFGVDSNNAGNLTDASNALGEIGQRQLSKFARLLKAYKDIPVKIVALHHSPNLPETAKRVEHKSWLQKKYTRYTHQIPQGDRRSLRLLCEAHGVQRIIHGHLHEYDDRTLNVRITGVPSSTQPSFASGASELMFNEYNITKSPNDVYRVRNVQHSLPYGANIQPAGFWDWICEVTLLNLSRFKV
ncbi:metallophosphoesterase family protein [Kordiimonas sp.]|uniref:metallophosphoesterase family protein n=1 Tax=Kordiimonas sp. TaxID=1970157 RepID=UPI003A9512F0